MSGWGTAGRSVVDVVLLCPSLAVYEAVLENAEQLLSPLLFHCLLLALSLHSQSPSVAMYQQVCVCVCVCVCVWPM